MKVRGRLCESQVMVRLGDEMIRLGCVIVRLWSMLD